MVYRNGILFLEILLLIFFPFFPPDQYILINTTYFLFSLNSFFSFFYSRSIPLLYYNVLLFEDKLLHNAYRKYISLYLLLLDHLLKSLLLDILLHKFHRKYICHLQQVLKVIHAGVTLGELKGKDIVPDHSLAMTIAMRQGKFLQAELSYEQAIGYLRKEAVVLDSSVPRGYILLTYKKIPLGFAKNIGNRANNLYPQEWRIRSGYLPDVLSMVWDD